MKGSEVPATVLFILHGAIGDVTRALTLAMRIKEQWPESKVIWGIEPRSLGVVENHPAIDRLIIFERKKGFKAYIRYLRALRRERPEITLDLQRIFKSGVASFCSGAKRRVGFHPGNSKEFNWIFNNEYISKVPNFSPKIKHYQLFGDKIGLPDSESLKFGIIPSRDSLKNWEQVIAAAIPERGKRVALILGSTWPSRFWPDEHYKELIHLMWDNYRLGVVLVGASSERRIAREIESSVVRGTVVNLVEKTSLEDLFSVFSIVHLAIGSDSGPMHIAAALGLPVISLWGSTSPLRSAPYGSERFILQSAIGCSPCYRKQCPGLNTQCMHDIVPAAVMAQLGKVLNMPC